MKQFNHHKYIFLIIIILFVNEAYTKTIRIKKIGRVQSDNSWIKVRMPSEKKIKDFKSKNDFQYHKENKLQQFLKSMNKRLENFFSKLFKDMKWKPPAWVNFQNIILLFSMVIFLFIIYLTLKSNLGGIFYNKKENPFSSNGVRIENIESIDFDSLINNYLKNEDYRMAVRMLYHKILKELSIANIIKWKIDKTNDDYIKEIKNNSTKSSFKELTHFFNYVWYGMFSIDSAEFNEINTKFDKFIMDINTGD